MSPADHPAFATVAEADAFRLQLLEEIQDIQAQLGNRNRTNENGMRVHASEYWEWKRRAQHQLNLRLEQLRRVKLWIQSNRTPPSDALFHLRAVLRIASTLAITETERSAISAAQAFLDAHDSR